MNKVIALGISFWIGAVASGFLTFHRCKTDGRAFFAGEHITCSIEKTP